MFDSMLRFRTPPSIHAQMREFHDQIVATDADRSRLSRLRKTNEAELRRGLRTLFPQSPADFRTVYQGSHDTWTAVRSDAIDVDIACIFPSWAFRGSPSAARRTILNALECGSRRFVREPEVRTNAVTVWYENGDHVDLAIYREVDGTSLLQHAGSEWRYSDPKAFAAWLQSQSNRRSPSFREGADVSDRQMLRVIRLVKAWAKQYADGDLPRGFPLAALIAECYQHDDRADDLSLVYTLRAMRDRLAMSRPLTNPVDWSESLVRRPVDVRRFGRLAGELATELDGGPLGELADADSDDFDAARRAWRGFFDHSPARWVFDG